MYKRKGSTKKGRKSYKRRTVDGVVKVPRSVNLSSWNTPFRTTMKYSDVIVLSTGVGTGFVTHTLTPNSLYDPDWTAAGHQPLRFDQMAAMFNTYRVRTANAKFNFAVGDVATSSSALGPWRCTVTKSRTNVSLPGTGSDFQTAAEMESAQTGVLTTNEKLDLYQSYNWRDVGINNIEEVQAPVSGVPPLQYFWVISLYNQGNVAATNVLCNFDITFDVEFLNPKTIATS